MKCVKLVNERGRDVTREVVRGLELERRVFGSDSVVTIQDDSIENLLTRLERERLIVVALGDVIEVG